jgi:hypothetical protein
MEFTAFIGQQEHTQLQALEVCITEIDGLLVQIGQVRIKMELLV